jgi:hypothetical protein
MTPLGSRTADGARAGGVPPRWWTLPVPCLLTLPVVAWCVQIVLLVDALSCFDTCMPEDGLLNATGVTELILALATVVTLIAGLALPAWRRALLWVIWIACALAWLGGAVVYARTGAFPLANWADAHP